MKIILGSSSKFRKSIMTEMGYDFEVVSPDIDEKAIRHDDPKRLVLEIAKAKAKSVLEKLQDDALVITSDQVVVCNGEIREKPIDTNQAREFIESYNEYPAETVTSIVVTNSKTDKQMSDIDIAKVAFKNLPTELIDALIEEGELMFCAGAFMVENELVKPYITDFIGTIDSIMGLPKKLTKHLIDQVR